MVEEKVLQNQMMTEIKCHPQIDFVYNLLSNKSCKH